MAEKVTGKKEDKQQQANKKNNKNQQQQQQQQQQQRKKQKKQVNSNTVIATRDSPKKKVPNNNKNIAPSKKNKEKNHNKNQGSKGGKRNINKSSGGSIWGSIFKLSLLAVISVAVFLGFLYVVDINKFRSILQSGGKALYGVRDYLPLEVVVQGEKVYLYYVRPTVKIAVDKVLVLFNQTSTVLNTNPVLKDHWSNINEISAIVGERLAEYMRTVYKQIPIYYDYAKDKLF